MGAPQYEQAGADIGGTGTIDTIPRWTGASTLGDSLLSQSGAIVTNSGTFRAANGAPAEPAYTFSGSSGTGMYRATSGALLRFAVSGAYAFGVDTNGNVGIGTASPIAGGLTVYGASNGQVFVQNSSGYTRLLQNGTDFYIDGNVSGSAGNIIFRRASSTLESARIDSAGRMCIGTTTATAGRALTTVADLDVFGVRVGRGAGDQATNTAVGASALNANTSGTNNTAMGVQASNLLTTGTGNTSYGYQSGFGTTTGSYNTYIGGNIATGSTSGGSNNAALGYGALSNIVGGGNNTVIGFTAGNTITSGGSNIVIGAGANVATAADSNQLALGSATNYVATNGGATTYYATAGALLGYMQIRLNGANVKIPVYAP